MMKLTILLFALIFVAHTCCASKSQEQRSCSDSIEEINLKKCEKHIMERIQDEDDDDDDSDVLATVRGRISYNRKNDKEQREEKDLEKYCCSEIRELDSSRCQCKALQKMMERQSEKLEDNEKKEMEKELRRVARKCGLGPMSGCELRSDD